MGRKGGGGLLLGVRACARLSTPWLFLAGSGGDSVWERAWVSSCSAGS